mmetsp:Transcript_14914/g.23728  ORF Transcript_14914/g.23728 Transcript_14914/m.23728 type:complete len:103 (-) Transcript_14914:1716-2024(-)
MKEDKPDIGGALASGNADALLVVGQMFEVGDTESAAMTAMIAQVLIICLSVPVPAWAYVHVCIYIYICAFTYTYICICMYLNACTSDTHTNISTCKFDIGFL